MQSKKKMIVNTVFLVAIFALTIYGVFHGEDLGGDGQNGTEHDTQYTQCDGC